EILLRLEVPVGGAIVWSLLIALSPPVLSHSFLFFTEIPSALIAIWLYRVLSNDASPRYWLLVGFAIGLLLLIHIRNIGLVAVFSAWSAYRLWRDVVPGFPGHRRSEREDGSRALLFALALALPIAVRTWAMWTFWGTLVTSPIAHPALGLS